MLLRYARRRLILLRRRLRRLAKDASKSSSSGRVPAALTEQRNMLRSRFRTWEQVQLIYMPGLLQYQTELSKNHASSAADSLPVSEHPEDAILWLPSDLPTDARRRVCREGLPRIEEKLRTVQLDDSLETIRHILRIKARMITFKNKNYRGQREGTRSRTIIDRVHQKARAAAEKYRQARKAKVELSGPGSWENKHQLLLDSDIRGFQDPNKLRPSAGRRGVREDDELEAAEAAGVREETERARENAGTVPAEFDLLREDRSQRDGTGETRRTLSWIWLVEGVTNLESEEVSDDILRAEWAKSRARAQRAREEVNLLKEEMRRTVKFLEWRSEWWQKKPTSWSGVSAQLSEGLRAYAMEQAATQKSLAECFEVLWETPLADYHDNSDHEIEASDPHNEELDDDDDGDDEFCDDEPEAEDLDQTV